MSRLLIVEDDRTTLHVLRHVLDEAGYDCAIARDGVEALDRLRDDTFDLLLLDVWMPRLNGLEVLTRLRRRKRRPRVIVMTSDDTPETVLKAVREQAQRYVHKPVQSDQLLAVVREVLEAPDLPPIDVISATPEWVELVVPCTREAVDRIQPVMARLDATLPAEQREAIAYAFRELLLNAIEWGGRLNPSHKVRIACLRSKRMLLYRIADPGRGFNVDNLPHAAVGHAPDDPIAHVKVREEQGLRPGGFGLLTVRASVDELIYNEKRNEVVFVKYLDDDRPGDDARESSRSRTP